MTDRSDDDMAVILNELVETLQELETEVEPTTDSGLPRPPAPSELLRFTTDVSIPAAILILRTNIEALQLLKRALKIADGRSTETNDTVAQRATDLSRTTLTKLEDALTDLQAAVEGRPENDEARELLEQARDLRSTLADELDTNSTDAVESDGVSVDVDSELQSIKDDVADQDGDSDEEK
jgi:hypothetical protein